MRRYFRGPLAWVALAVLGVFVLSQFLGSGGGYKNADLSKVESLMASKSVRSVQIKDKWFTKSYTPKNGRYPHPYATAAEIAAQKTGGRPDK